MMVFKYKLEKREDGNIRTPQVPIVIYGKVNPLSTMGLLDSGSDSILLPRAIGDVLGVDFTKKPKRIDGITGPTEAIEETFSLKLLHPHAKPITTRMDFLIDPKFDIPILLGRVGFFVKYDILFKESEKKVIIKNIT